MFTIDWDARYRDGETPWEKGMAHPALPFFIESHPAFFEGKPRLFHPGCGYGRDAAHLAPLCREITALDIAEEAITNAKNLYPALENIRWEQGDLFTWDEPEHYDLVWEHTCFCAITPSYRAAYVRAIHTLLKPGGLLLGIFFLTPDHPIGEGPPFRVSRDQLNHFFGKDFELIEDIPNPPTYDGREDTETIMIWRKRP